MSKPSWMVRKFDGNERHVQVAQLKMGKLDMGSSMTVRGEVTLADLELLNENFSDVQVVEAEDKMIFLSAMVRNTEAAIEVAKKLTGAA